MALKGNPTILIVDDEAIMREIAQMIVEENGGQTLVACNGKEALDIFNDKFSTIDHVFIDFSMPHLNGYETLIEMKRIKPSINIVMASGLDAIPEVKALVCKNEIQFINKPFRELDLVEAFNKMVK